MWWNKIKELFQSKWVKLRAWMLVAIGAVVLAIAGATSAEVSGAITLTFAIVAAVGALIAYISVKYIYFRKA